MWADKNNSRNENWAQNGMYKSNFNQFVMAAFATSSSHFQLFSLRTGTLSISRAQREVLFANGVVGDLFGFTSSRFSLSPFIAIDYDVVYAYILGHFIASFSIIKKQW